MKINGLVVINAFKYGCLFDYVKLCSHGVETMLSWARSYVLTGSKLYSCGVEVIFLWGRSYVLAGSKLCSCGVEAMFLRGRSYVPNVVTL